MWTCVLCELVSVTLRDAPHSSAAVKLTSWLPSTVIHYLQSITLNTSRFTVSQYIGLALLTAGAFVHLAARLSLSEYVVFPLISSNSRPRMLYVPPSLIPPEATSIDSPLPILEPPKPEVAWSLRVSHRLITKGPYAHVRHPMYFGAFITFIGTGFFHFSKGAFLRTVLDTLSSNLNPQGNLFSWIGIGLAGVIAFETTFGLAKRAAWEDVALQERFGKEYSVYRWRVPYGFVPGIY